MTLAEYINRHGRAIIASSEREDIGTIVSGIELPEGPLQAVRIMRETSADEFEAQPVDPPCIRHESDAGYYEIRTD